MSQKIKKIAVVGGGLFGISQAIILGKDHRVDLYEKNSDILMSASLVNQYRLHKGYHYPRSYETTQESINAERSFLKYFNECVITDTNHYYGIAKDQTLTDSHHYISHCEKFNLPYNIVEPDFLKNDMLQLCVEVSENHIDPVKLRSLSKSYLASLSNIQVLLNTEFLTEFSDSYDFVINCTYASLNDICPNVYKFNYQFEVVEKILISLPSSFHKTSIVIMDGPFCSLDPYGTSDNYLMGHVVHAVHKTSIGTKAIIPPSIRPLIDKGLITNPKEGQSNYEKFIESGSEFIPILKHARYKGSMYAVRAVLPNVDNTDERPTIVRPLNDRLINVFSGKLVSCVQAALSVKKIIEFGHM
jgi:hypothetical protein